ncbi:cupin domain-containing protein [Jannaschia sp. 2305UL9-9]|uniref:cupin domain-containing protein n=1 Tax=Jannaschia sp. 2305UL9-9 TaxID=3121638 RepID=UPI003526FB0C
MTNWIMSLTDGTTQAEAGVVWTRYAHLKPDDHPAGQGTVLEDAAKGDLSFVLTREPLFGPVLHQSQITLPAGPVLLRLDEVFFPPGAIAYRHVHPGPGIRHLVRGRLHLQADDHAFEAAPGDSWFEDANSPVRATALEQSSFVRFMVLPPEFAGKSTLTILSDEDRARPRRQQTHRHVDALIHPGQ